jgi:mannitol-specific phosphotransferase system IIBC component
MKVTLIECVSCKTLISNKAANCPCCGHPYTNNMCKTEGLLNKIFVVFIGVLFAQLIIFAISTTMLHIKTNKAQEKMKSLQEQTASIEANLLRREDIAKFKAIEEELDRKYNNLRK